MFLPVEFVSSIILFGVVPIILICTCHKQEKTLLQLHHFPIEEYECLICIETIPCQKLINEASVKYYWKSLMCSCSRIYHLECWQRWKKHHACCPICKTPC